MFTYSYSASHSSCSNNSTHMNTPCMTAYASFGLLLLLCSFRHWSTMPLRAIGFWLELLYLRWLLTLDWWVLEHIFMATCPGNQLDSNCIFGGYFSTLRVSHVSVATCSPCCHVAPPWSSMQHPHKEFFGSLPPLCTTIARPLLTDASQFVSSGAYYLQIFKPLDFASLQIARPLMHREAPLWNFNSMKFIASIISVWREPLD